MHIIAARTPQQYLAAVALFKEYAMGLEIDLAFQKFDDELQMLPIMYGPPMGELWLLQENEHYVGCAALRQLDTKICELKRMFVQDQYRRLGFGEQLMQKAIQTANTLGYEYMRLDSLRRLTPALKLYVRYGFEEIAAYNHNPEADVVYFELKLLP